MRFLWKSSPRCFVILFTVVVFIFPVFSMGCNQQTAMQNTPIDSQDIPVVELSGLLLPGDVFYVDPVVTQNQELPKFLKVIGKTERSTEPISD